MSIVNDFSPVNERDIFLLGINIINKYVRKYQCKNDNKHVESKDRVITISENED